MDQLIREIEAAARRIMGEDPAHGWPHIVRVRRNARMIVEAEDLAVDWLVLDAAILLHDVGRNLPGEGHHALKSASYARELLAGLNAHGIIDRVEHAIKAHSYSLGVPAETVEAKVLSDADKLDALGAIGVARAFHHGCTVGRGFETTIEHMLDKLVKLPRYMYFEHTRRIAAERVEFIQLFIRQYRLETGWGNP
ncbi:MAG: HD domain-containing protein [Desulfurococcales archaeon]|nr:HD domain-containing protein [Desulfurococcales archaeon]